MPPNKKAPAELELIEDIAKFTFDPYGFVIYAFSWGEGELKDFSGPDQWQKEILIEIGDLLKAGVNFNEAFNLVIQEAVASGNGIGKSTLIAWLILWGMSTQEDTRGVVTAGTDTQLKTKTWSELAKWHRLCICGYWFKYEATSIHSVEPKHEKTWRIDAIPWNKTRPDAFAGLHNYGKRIMILCDEASAIDDVIYDDGIKGALTDSNTQIIFVAFGNPVRNYGWFRECFRKQRHRWHIRQIDSRSVKISNKTQIAQWIEDYGIDSDFVKAHVRGEFPNASDLQFISEAIITPARGRHLRLEQYNFAAKILTCDPAWTGGDETVIGLRQGLAFKILGKYARNDNDAVIAGYLMGFEDQYQADAVFIDFGFGTGIYSFGKESGRHWTLVEFGGASSDPGYLNKRAEMWKLMKDWLREGGAIPDDPQLAEELMIPEYRVKATGKDSGKIYLESKEDIRAKGLPSPNRADALAISFAVPVQPKNNSRNNSKLNFANSQYDVLNTFGGVQSDYDVLDLAA
jgi:hypothetical protein